MEMDVCWKEYFRDDARYADVKILRRLRKLKGLSAGEYLYGFGKDRRLYPVVTFVLYGGKEDWDGPESLHEMLDWTGIPETLRKYVSGIEGIH